MFYTSYFGNIHNIPADYHLVSIARYPPRGWMGLQYYKLAPTPEMLTAWKRNHDEAAYMREYANIVKALGVNLALADLESTDDKPTVLLCYEKPGQFCHRHLVARWFRKNGIDIREL